MRVLVEDLRAESRGLDEWIARFDAEFARMAQENAAADGRPADVCRLRFDHRGRSSDRGHGRWLLDAMSRVPCRRARHGQRGADRVFGGRPLSRPAATIAVITVFGYGGLLFIPAFVRFVAEV